MSICMHTAISKFIFYWSWLKSVSLYAHQGEILTQIAHSIFLECVQLFCKQLPWQSGGGSVHSPMEVHWVESVPLSMNPFSQLMLQLELKLNSTCGWEQCREPWGGAVSMSHSWAGKTGIKPSDPNKRVVLNPHRQFFTNGTKRGGGGLSQTIKL